MVEIAVISDTHIPSRASEIPDWVAERVRDADHTIHAGDFDSPEAYEAVVALTDGDLTTVAGNMDPDSLDLPEVATVEVQGTTFVVTHGTAQSMEEYGDTIAEAVSEELDGPGIAVAGHTHEVRNDDVAGIRLLNPGSATAASPAEAATMMTVQIIEGDMEVEVYAEDEKVEV